MAVCAWSVDAPAGTGYIRGNLAGDGVSLVYPFQVIVMKKIAHIMVHITRFLAGQFLLTVLMVVLLTMLLIAVPVFASGGGNSGGSGSGGSGSGASGGGGNASAPTANYDIGKSVFFRKLHCDSCPLSGLTLDQQSVASILPSLTAGGDLGGALSYRERYAVRYFLKRRFNL